MKKLIPLLLIVLTGCGTMAQSPAPPVCTVEAVEAGLEIRQEDNSTTVQSPALLLELLESCRRLHET